MRQARMVDRLVWWILQLGYIQECDFKQVTHSHDFLDFIYIVFFIKPEFRSQHTPVCRVHSIGYLQTDNGGEMAMTEF